MMVLGPQLLLLHPVLLCCLGLHFLPPVHGGETTTAVQVFYVKPTENTSCPEPCHTLDEYVQNTTWYFVSNTTFRFLPGNHELGQPLNVSGVANLVLVAASGTVNITCRYNSFLSFSEVSNLTLKDLTLSLCDTLVLTNLLNLNLLEITMQPSEMFTVDSYLVHARDILGTSIMTGLSISPNCMHCRNIMIKVQYTNHSFWLVPTYNQLTISNSILSTANMLDMYFELYQSNYALNLLLDNLAATDDFLSVTLSFDIVSNAQNNIIFKNLHFHETLNGWISVDMSAGFNTSLYIGNCHFSIPLQLILISSQVTIESTLIEHSSAPNMQVLGSAIQGSFTIRNVTFTNSIRTYDQEKSADYADGVVYLENVHRLKFSDCKFVSIFSLGALVLLVSSNDISFVNCEFSDNNGSPIVAIDSTFALSGSNIFKNNCAQKGGAIAFYGHSRVMFTNGSYTIFVNNSAGTVGGAIYVEYVLNSLCFFNFQLSLDAQCNQTIPIMLSSDHNTAKSGGELIYGAALDSCAVDTAYQPCGGWNFASTVFHIDPQTDTHLSAISSDPTRVCLCENERPACTTVFSNLTRYPGEPFQVSAVVVGDRFGTVDGSVYAQLLHLGTGVVAELGDLEHSQRVEHLMCTNLTYTILTNSTTATLALTATDYNAAVQHYSKGDIEFDISTYVDTGEITPLLRSTPVYIDVNLPPCPLGFVLSGEPPRCTCDTQLLTHHITCNLTTQTVQRSGSEWINASFHGNTSNGVIVNMHCPNGYCKPETVEVNLEYPDTQCAFSHSGILCGGCQSGLSLALGSAQCVPCSNDYLALLIPFALAGVVLVLFMRLLNLTISQGALNGLIFYANIVRANQTAWIPSHDYNILMVFIAWFNLDLGIDTCFFDGMDAYWRTWLQFVFPLYIWAIVIIIIVLSHYFSTAAKIFGNNSVPILATLFLLSYSKLLRTIISIFQSSTLDYPDGTSATVWSYDGNVPYFSPKRIPLILVALMVLLFLWLPYTGTLLFAQCLQKIPNYRVASLLLKLKPFFDAYFGPLKDKHRYWIGLLLLVRGVLFVVYAATPTNMANINLLATGIVMFCPLVYPDAGHVYRKTHLNLLENSFFLNLGILAVGTLYLNSSGGSRAALAYTSIGTAFAQFAAIVFFHALTMLKTTRCVREWRNRNIVNPGQVQAEYDRLPEEPQINRQGVRELHLSFNDFREPVLKYADN